MGMMQELLHKIPTPKLKKSRFTRILSYLKYVLLAVFVFFLPLWNAVKGLPLPAFCKYICPAGTLEGAVGLLSHPVNADKYAMLGGLFTGKMLILLLMILACVFVYRAFCRFICPLGAIYGLFSRVALIGVRVDLTSCVHCGKCERHCPMDIRHVGDHECIHCGECIDVCPTNAITLQAGKIVLRANETAPKPARKKRRLLVWLTAIILLAGLMVYVNQPVPETPVPAEIAENSLPVGSEEGMRAADFTVPVYGGGDYTLSAQRGKVTVVNFWATWCTPWVKELPHFDALQKNYDDRVSVVAVHSNLVTENVAAYLEKLDYSMPFALDETGGVIASFGGSAMLPQTVVIDADGVIVYNKVGSLTYEALESVVLSCLREE